MFGSQRPADLIAGGHRVGIIWPVWHVNHVSWGHKVGMISFWIQLWDLWGRSKCPFLTNRCHTELWATDWHLLWR